MYFHCQTLYLKSSKMELVTFSLFSFIQSNLKGFQLYFSSPRCFVVLGVEGWGGIQVGCSFPLGFLSPGIGTPGDLGRDVTDKMYQNIASPKHRPWCLDCFNLVSFSKLRIILNTEHTNAHLDTRWQSSIFLLDLCIHCNCTAP